MLRVFSSVDQKLKEVPHQPDGQLVEEQRLAQIRNAIWLDLQDPSEEEVALVESLNDSNLLPDIDDVEEIEASARYYTENGNIYVHSLFLHHVEGKLKTATVAFIIKEQQLLTFRDVELADFRLLRLRARRNMIPATHPIGVVLALLEQKIEDLADALEDIYYDIEQISADITSQDSDSLQQLIQTITHQDDENGRIRMCLMDTRRAITFLQRHLRHEDDFELCREMLRDIETLTAHSNFIFEKVNFLMDASQGFINIQQNKIIKTLSVATVIFMPPTLVASMYGMNFSIMPELGWKWGYHFAQAVMLGSAALTLIYFKWKKLL